MPETPNKIGEDFKDYTAQVEQLKERRKDLVERLGVIMRDEVIPEVKTYLPEHYSIDSEGSEYYSNIKDGKDLTEESARLCLRVLCDDESITFQTCDIEEMGTIQDDPRLKELAERYGLSEISIST